MIRLERTHKDDPRFLDLVSQLDRDLSLRYEDGNTSYTPFNALAKITAVVLALSDNEPAGCGAFKPFLENGVEIKRVFVKPAFRGRGISKRIMAELEAWAAEKGCVRAVLETGVHQPEAISLYEGAGYRRRENFEPYVGLADSICFEKPLLPTYANRGGNLLIRPYEKEDLSDCVQILMAAYNSEPWRNHWTEETGSRYLKEYADAAHFLGWIAMHEGRPAGALFGHRKVWWTQDELFVDELFVHPDFQGKGHGKRLLQVAEAYCMDNGLAGVTLLTDRNMPALAFYQQNGYSAADHVIFMYKVVSPMKTV
jgi:GNAT superfamily N-acetyltransferase